MNDPRQLYFDERLKGFCIYCGSKPNTKDHCPSKVLLDEPFPENLPVVEACDACNQSFSLDEQYFACFLECVISGSTDPKILGRQKIQRILSETPRLAAEIQSTLTIDANGNKVWQPDMERVRKVVLKLARGHLYYELCTHGDGDPAVVEIAPLIQMPPEKREIFERPVSEVLGVWPEIGTRAFMRIAASSDGITIEDDWQELQKGRYRYLVGQGQGDFVHIVISDYLACRIVWDDTEDDS